MAGVWNRMLNFLGFEEEIVEDEPALAEAERAAVPEPVRARRPHREHAAEELPRVARYGALVPLAGGQARGANAGSRVIVWQPASFDEVQGLVDRLREGCQIVVNFEGVDRQLSGRLINFLSGSVYALGGSMYRVSSAVMLFEPAGVTVEPAGGEDARDWWTEGEPEA